MFKIVTWTKQTWIIHQCPSISMHGLYVEPAALLQVHPANPGDPGSGERHLGPGQLRFFRPKPGLPKPRAGIFSHLVVTK